MADVPTSTFTPTATSSFTPTPTSIFTPTATPSPTRTSTATVRASPTAAVAPDVVLINFLSPVVVPLIQTSADMTPGAADAQIVRFQNLRTDALQVSMATRPQTAADAVNPLWAGATVDGVHYSGLRAEVTRRTTGDLLFESELRLANSFLLTVPADEFDDIIVTVRLPAHGDSAIDNLFQDLHVTFIFDFRATLVISQP